MNKEMIKRIALKTLRGSHCDMTTTDAVNFAELFLTAIDAEQAAEIERSNRAYEAIDEQRNRDFESLAQQAERIAAQAALIEKCENALRAAAEWGSPMLAAPRSTRPEWIGRVRSALAAIAAHKKGE